MFPIKQAGPPAPPPAAAPKAGGDDKMKQLMAAAQGGQQDPDADDSGGDSDDALQAIAMIAGQMQQMLQLILEISGQKGSDDEDQGSPVDEGAGAPGAGAPPVGPGGPDESAS